MDLIDKLDSYAMHRGEKKDKYSYLYHADEEMDSRGFADEIRDFKKNSKYPFIIGVIGCVVILHIIISLVLYVAGIMKLSPGYINSNPFYILFWFVMPVGIWVWSTAFDFWNYWDRKIGLLYLVVANACFLVMTQLMRFLYPIIISLVLKIPITSKITTSMVVNLGRAVMFSVSFVPALLIFIAINSTLIDPVNKETVLHFKILRLRDIRKNPEFKYDLKIVTNLETGKVHHVKEKDRTLHTLSDGVTGTGKSSSTLIPAIVDDLDQKVHNEDYQKKECAKRLEMGDFSINAPFEDEDFSIRFIDPVLTGDKKKDKEIQDAYDFLKYESSSAGITVIAPNAAFADEVCNLAYSRGFKVRRLDPVLDENDRMKRGCVAFNPIYVSPLIKGIQRDVDITNKAVIVADIFKSLYELSGSTDAYFVSLNSIITTGICKLVMLTFPSKMGRQPTLQDVQVLINTPQKCTEYVEELVKLYGNHGKAFDNGYKVDIASRDRIDCGKWQDVYDMVVNEMTGENANNIYDRANGLRNQFNGFLNHPLVRNVLCPEDPDMESLDLDRALMDGEIVVVDYALELGQSVSMAFGMFFMLSYSLAVRRRPGDEDTRLLNFCYIDELPTIINKDVETFVTLFRQYKVASFFALQTLDQMDKTPLTKYLRGVLLGNCAHHIVFGRISPTEMKTYETMAGMMPDSMEQKTVSETSMSMEDPAYSYSTRTTMQEKATVTGSQMRYRDFQEVTFFTVDDGSPVPPFFGKVNFIASALRKGFARIRVDWKRWQQRKEFYTMAKNDERTPMYAKQEDRAVVLKPQSSSTTFSFLANGQIRVNDAAANAPVKPKPPVSATPEPAADVQVSGGSGGFNTYDLVSNYLGQGGVDGN